MGRIDVQIWNIKTLWKNDWLRQWDHIEAKLEIMFQTFSKNYLNDWIIIFIALNRNICWEASIRVPKTAPALVRLQEACEMNSFYKKCSFNWMFQIRETFPEHQNCANQDEK